MTTEPGKKAIGEWSPFAQEIHMGLSSEQKFISSKYFYDERGDILFTQIMEMEEYYLTNSEFEILASQKSEIFRSLPFGNEDFDLVELGSGDGTKTKILLQEFMKHNGKFHYVPIDISENSLSLLRQNLLELFPLKINPFNALYLDGLKEVYQWSPKRPKLILFMGSNIGNLERDKTVEFLQTLNQIKNEKDLLIIGIDLKKDPIVIKNAYDDPHGITREFNLNVLDRINRELGGNFDRSQFYHYPTYDPITGAAKSYLVSKKVQEVYLSATDSSYSFKKGETVFTEISQKYSLDEFQEIAESSGLKVIHEFTDNRKYFADILIQ